MKKIINLLSILGIVVAPVTIGFLYSFDRSPQATALAKEATAFAGFPQNQTRFVDFKADDQSLHRLTEREQKDQLRDWLLFTVVSDKGLSAKEIGQSLYDLPTVRYGYMKPVSNFEYGDTRSLDMGKGQVVALLPSGMSQQERMDNLAHIADKHRKDTGKIPSSLLVFEYQINLDKQYAQLTRREVLDGQKLFTEGEYGYHEADVKNLDDLQRFMNQVDDVTFAQVKGSSLNLGGRKINNRKYRGIRVEDIAAIWQSEKKIQTETGQFEARWQEKINLLPAEEQNKGRQQASEEWHKLKLVNGSGFSLDPSYDYRSFEQFFTKAEPIFQLLSSVDASAITKQDIQQAKLGLTKDNAVPYLVLADKLSKSKNPKLAEYSRAASAVAERYRFQSARYDGDLQGTEAGMVLFYTDLLAKLWALDYLGTTPNRYVQDFKPLTNVSVSSIYKQEIKELPNTRLWFGVQNKGFQVADRGNSMLFARNATRIYAASSNPLQPGVETAAAANSEAFLGWWNDHYEEVAHYEPQYERLNEIMKWSLLISWLNKANKGETLEFLQAVQVKHDNWFPDWVRTNSEQLKFQKWDRVGFKERGYKDTKTETMPMLVSDSFKEFGEQRYFSGGVSLASQDLFEGRTALPTTGEVSELGLRSNLNYGSVKSSGNSLNLNTLEGTAYQLKSLNSDLSSVVAQAKEGMKFRNPESELANLEFSHDISRTDSGLQIKTSMGGTELGSLSVAKTENGFSVGWLSRDIDEGQSLATRLSPRSKDMEKVLLDSSDVESIAKLRTNPPSYLVKMYDSNHWLKVAEEVEASSNIPSGWQSRAGDFGDDSRNIDLAWVDEKTVTRQLAEGIAEPIRYSPPREGSDDRWFADNLQNKKYEAIAEKFVENPVTFLAFVREHFNVELKRIDNFLQAKNYTKAAQHIDDSIHLYGDRPDLMLRKAVVDIYRGRLNIELVTPGQPMIGLLLSRKNFLDEVNGLLGSTGSKVKFVRIETDNARFYVHDNPGLNNLNWNPSIDPSQPLIAAKARLYQLHPGDIAHVKLGIMGLGDPSGATHSSTSGATHSSTNFNVSNLSNYLNHLPSSNGSESDNCENGKEEKSDQCVKENHKEKPTYILLVSPEVTQ